MPLSTNQPLSIDQWYDEAKSAVDLTVARQAREQAYNLFERKTKKEEPLFEDVGKGIFDRGQPAHKVGVVERAPDGSVKIWIDPYCYLSSVITFEGRKDVPICAGVGTNVNLSDMFSEIKPEYLKRPLPEPKVAN